MKPRFAIPVVLLLAAGTATADNLDAKFALHRVPASYAFYGCGPGNPNVLGTSCSDYTVTAPLGESYVYMVVGETGDEGVYGISFGIDYDGRAGQMNGIDPATATFTPCNRSGQFWPNGSLYGPFPSPYSAVRMTFEDETGACYEHPVIGAHGRHVLVGYFYVVAYAEDVLRVTANNQIDPHGVPELLVLDCGDPRTTADLFAAYGSEMDRILGRVHFGGDGSQGYTPCAATPALPATWGRLKSLYLR